MKENDDKNDPSRFLSDGVAFRAKLIGILEVGEARGDRMCQEALQDLKVAIRAAGEHKQRITVHVAIDGLRLRDEKTGDSLYHHPVHKISFIAQDMTDSRAFGYIFGSPDSGHRFFGIKTEKSASQVVIAMRDLFQVVFELKKKEIELARLQIQGKSRTTEPSVNGDTVSKISAIGEIKPLVIEPSTSKVSPESIADLVDLEQELNSLQRGLNQMERLTPSDGPQSIVAPGNSSSDPFGDSFASFTPPPCLPPPPSSRERPSRCVEPPFSPPFSPPPVLKTPFSPTPMHQGKPQSIGLTSKTATTSILQERPIRKSASPDWLHGEEDCFEDPNPLDNVNISKPLPFDDVFTELDPLGTGRSKPYVDKKHFFQELKNPPKKVLRDLVGDNVVSILQPLESKTGLGGKFSDESSKLVSISDNSLKDMDPFNDPFDQADLFIDTTFKPQIDPFDTDFVPFKIFNNQQINPIKATSLESKTPTLLTDTRINASEDSNDGDNFFNGPLQVSLPPERASSYIPSKSPKIERQTSTPTAVRNRPTVSKQNTIDGSRRKNKQHIILTQKFNKDGGLSESLEGPPEPPPRPEITSSMPPPLPPKKQFNDIIIRPPPRPPHNDNDSHYDYIDNYNTKATDLYSKFEDEEKSPPLPVPARKPRFEDNFIPQRPKKEEIEDPYLTPISLNKKDSQNITITKIDKPLLLPPPQRKDNVKKDTADIKIDTKALDMSLSDLLSCGVEELAKKLNTSTVKITNMTIIQLTNYLKQYLEEAKRQQSIEDEKTETEEVFENQNNFADFSSKTFEANFDQFDEKSGTYDRYAVFREIQEKENLNKPAEDLDDSQILNEVEEMESMVDSEIINEDNAIEEPVIEVKTEDNSADRYAALRSIFVDENEGKSLVENNINNDDFKGDVSKNKQDKNFDADLKSVLMQIADDYKPSEHSLSNKFRTSLSVTNDKPEIDFYKSISQPISRNKSPVSEINKSSNSQNKSPVLSKSPMKAEVSHISADNVPNHVRLTSGSLSDVISGSSPEIDNLTVSPDMKKQEMTSTSESWAIFDTPNTVPEPPKTINQSTSPLPIFNQTNIEDLTIENNKSNAAQQMKVVDNIKTLPLYDSNDKLIDNLLDSAPSKNIVSNKKLDEGMSPWSSDGKEFYGSPTEWPNRASGGDERKRRHHRESGWSKPQTSSSSRDASPWDEEGPLERRGMGGSIPHNEMRVRRARNRRRDSWDDEEFDYEEESGHPNWYPRRQHPREPMMRSREYLDSRQGPPGPGWYSDRPPRSRDDYSDRSLEDVRYDRKSFEGRDGFERKSFDRKTPGSSGGGFKNFDRQDDRMYHERSRHYGYSRESCDSYDDRENYENWDRDMYDRHEREDFKYSGQKSSDHWLPPSDRKYGGRYATVGGRGLEHRRRGRPCREWGSDWGAGGPSDEWEQDSDPDDRGMNGRYGRSRDGRTWSNDAVANENLDRTSDATSPLDGDRVPQYPDNRPSKSDISSGGGRSWKRPASATESDRRPDRKQIGHQQVGGSDNERDRRYRTKSRSRSRESQFSEIRPPKPDKQIARYQVPPHTNTKHYADYNSMDGETGRTKHKFPQSDFDENRDFDKFDMNTSDAKFEADFSQFYNLPQNSRFRDSDPSDKDSPRSMNSDGRKNDSAGFSKSGLTFKFENQFDDDNDFDNDNGLKMKVDTKQSFEDDFIPPTMTKTTSRLSENANFESISEEIDEKLDSVGNMEPMQNDFNHRNQNKPFGPRNRNQTKENLKKSESVNIFARDLDPFDDDDFFKNGSKNTENNRSIDTIRNKKELYQDNLKWPSDSKFEVFDD